MNTIRDSQREGIISRLVLKLERNSNDSTEANLRKYSDELLAMLDDIASTDRLVMHLRNTVNNGEPESTVREEICFAPCLPQEDSVSMKFILMALHRYPGIIESDDFSREDETTKDACRALIRVTELLVDHIAMQNFNNNNDRENGFILQDQELVRLIVNHTGKIDLIMDFIRERLEAGSEVVDSALLAEMLDLPAPALSHGIL